MIHYITISRQGVAKETSFSLRIYNYLPKIIVMIFPVGLSLFVLFFCFLIGSYEKYRPENTRCNVHFPGLFRKSGSPVQAVAL